MHPTVTHDPLSAVVCCLITSTFIIILCLRLRYRYVQEALRCWIARGSVLCLCVCISLSLSSPLYLPNEWISFNDTGHNWSLADIGKTNGIKNDDRKNLMNAVAGEPTKEFNQTVYKYCVQSDQNNVLKVVGSKSF